MKGRSEGGEGREAVKSGREEGKGRVRKVRREGTKGREEGH